MALAKLLQFTRSHRKAIPVLIILGLLASIAEGLGIGLLIPVVSSMLITDGVGAAGPFARAMDTVGALAEGDRQLLFLSILIAGLIAIKTLVLVVNVRLAAVINGNVTRELRVSLFRRLLSMDYGAFGQLNRGRLMNLLDVQTYRASEALMHAVSLLTATCFLLVFTILLLLISWQLTIIVVLIAVPISMFVRARTRRAHTYAEEQLQRNSSLTSGIMELLGSMRTIRILGQEATELERLSVAADAAQKSFVRTETVTWTVVPMVELFYVPVFLVVLGYAWHSGIAVPSLLAFLVLLYRMQPQLSRIDYARVSLGGFAPGILELARLLDTPGLEGPRSGSLCFNGLKHGIHFDQVTFSYQGSETPTVHDVCFTIPSGSVFAIVGRSGAGKSTLLNLLFRLYDPTHGEIRFDGIPLKEYDLSSIRSSLAFAGQDADLMAGTIFDNIVFGATDTSLEAVERAARAAHAMEFIRELPLGLNTAVGDRGINLSGGQRQRIALARALAREPDLLVLDEATNAVDNLAEQAIHETIRELKGRCTIVIVAHRLNTVNLADQVVLIADGRIAEQGSPDQMIGLRGEFSRLYDLE